MNGIFTFGSADFSKKIKAETFNITPNARQDLDSYRDADGVLHRTALNHTATIVEFDLIPMRENEMRSLMNAVKSSYINYNERDALCSYFDPETGTIKSGHFYLDSNLSFNYYGVFDGEIFYGSTHLKFVEY